MTQDEDLDRLVRQRLRGLRQAQELSLDELGARAHMSPSTLSRIETGQRRIGLDQLSSLVRALGTTIDQLVETVGDEDVVIRPQRDVVQGMVTWMLSRDSGPNGVTVAKMRITRRAPKRRPGALKVHPGRDWFTVLSGTVVLMLGERTLLVEAGQAAEFSTMEPHALGAHAGPAEILCIFDPAGRRTHLEEAR